jgi:hypothetical protein
VSEFVYFIRCEAPVEEKPIKVGIAARPRQRMVELRCSSPWPLTLLRTVEGSLRLEAALHRYLDADRLCGEWFRPSERMSELLALSDTELRERFAVPHPGEPTLFAPLEPREPRESAAEFLARYEARMRADEEERERWERELHERLVEFIERFHGEPGLRDVLTCWDADEVAAAYADARLPR